MRDVDLKKPKSWLKPYINYSTNVGEQRKGTW